MADDVKLEILLQAKNQSAAAFNELKQQLVGMQQEMAKTAKASESSFNLDKVKGQLLAAAGSIYGAYKVIGQAIDMAGVGAKLENQAAAFQNLSSAAGASVGRMLGSLKKASNGLVAEADLIGAAGKAMLMNIPAGEITKLMEVAAATSRMTGQTITEAFNDITLGVARQSKMILDNLGIIVDVDRANQDYARALGKTADALTDAEKRQAFSNATLKSGTEMIERLGSSQGTLEGVNKALTAQKNLWDEISRQIARTAEGPLVSYSQMIDSLTVKLKKWVEEANAENMIEEFRRIENLRARERLGHVPAGSTSAALLSANRRWVGASEAELAAEASMKAWKAPDQFAAWRYREGQWFDYTEAEKKAMIEARDKALKSISQTKPAASIWEGWGVRPYTESEAFLADQKAWDDFKKRWEGFGQRPYQESEAVLADQKRFDEWTKENEGAFSWITDLSARTAESMQENFSSLFFDAYKGKLSSFQDFTQAVFDSILRAWSDLQGQMVTQAIFGNKAVGGTAGSGGLLSYLVGAFGSESGPQQLSGPTSAKGNVFGPAGMVRFALGGVVTRPTVFPFSRGIGLMGEAGPEAVMPLKRMPSGRLGVESSTGAVGAVKIDIHNHTGQPVETRETRGPSGQREIEIMVGQILAKDGPASRALVQRYGLARRGIMR